MYTHSTMLNDLRAIADQAEHISLDRDQLPRVAAIMRSRLGINDFGVSRDAPDLFPADLLQFYLIAGSHNFLFWQADDAGEIVPWRLHVNGELRFGAPAAYACHVRALPQGRNILDADYLARMTLKDMEDHYRDEITGAVTLQSIPERLAKFNEIGQVLLERYDGSFLTLLKAADGHLFRDDGHGIVQRLVEDFPTAYGDWPFCKLIMVAVGNLYEVRDQLFPRESPYRVLIELRDPENLEVGADYYRPFFFYRLGLLRISRAFRERLVNKTLIERDSPMEREYRAWTILAARELADQLGVLPHDIARETWGMGFMRCRPCYIGVREDEVPCSYRSSCHSYNHETSLMEAVWPLVLTTNY